MSCLERWSIGSWILSVMLMVASCIGIMVYTTLRLHGCGNALFVVRLLAWIHLMSSRLFSKWVGTFLSSV